MSEIWCKNLEHKEERHQCFRKKCFREIYDYNARSIVKTRLPTVNVINYYMIKRRDLNIEAYESILTSYYNWLKFPELRDDLFGYVTLFRTGENYECAATFDKYIAIATISNIFIYENIEELYHSIDLTSSGMKVKEIKFGFYADNDGDYHTYLVTRSDSGSLQAWDIENKQEITTPVLHEDKELKLNNLCYGTARNFYSSSDNLIINKYKMEPGKMEVESSLDLSTEKKKGSKKAVAEGMKIYSEKIVALDSNDINIYAVTCRVDKHTISEEETLYLERFVCEDVLLICDEGGIAYDRNYCYEPLPKEFDSTTKVYLTIEDFIICTCGKNIAVYDDPVHTWIKSELIDDYQYVETLIIHANLLLVGFNTGMIFGYDVSIMQSLVKPNFFNGAKFKISEITEPIISFNVFEHKINDDIGKQGTAPRKDVYYPYILITSKKNTHLFKFTENYPKHYLDNVNNPPVSLVSRGVEKNDDRFTLIEM